MEEENKKKGKDIIPLTLLIVFFLSSLCAGIGYQYSQLKVKEVFEDIDVQKELNKLGSNTNVVKVYYDFNGHFYGCYKSKCDKLNLNTEYYDFDNRTEDEFDDDGESGSKVKVSTEGSTLNFEKDNKLYSIDLGNDITSVRIMGDKEHKNHYLYILDATNTLNKLNDEEFKKIGTSETKIDIEKFSNKVKSYYIADYTNTSDVPMINAIVNSSDGLYYSVDNNLYSSEQLYSKIRFNSDFILYNLNTNIDDNYNYLKYNNEILVVTSIFYKDDRVMIIDKDNNIYTIVQNNIRIYNQNKVRDINKVDDKIVINYEDNTEEKIDFNIEKIILLNNDLYFEFKRE